MSDKTANLRRSTRDLEGGLERARANLERAIGRVPDENGVIERALKDLAWEIRQALKTFKQQILAHEATS